MMVLLPHVKTGLVHGGMTPHVQWSEVWNGCRYHGRETQGS